MRFIRMGLVYLALLYFVIGYVLFHFSFNIIEYGPDFTYNKAHCTLYCEKYKCPHPSQYEHLHGALQAQVKILHAIPVDYQTANLLVYVFGYSLFVFACAAYLILPNRHETRH